MDPKKKERENENCCQVSSHLEQVQAAIEGLEKLLCPLRHNTGQSYKDLCFDDMAIKWLEAMKVLASTSLNLKARKLQVIK